MKPVAPVVLAILAIFTLGGCKSVSSTYVTRNPDGCGWETKRLRGAPITVWVPSHLEVRVKEVRYLYANTPLTEKVGGKDVPVVTREVDVFVREKKEVFTVDFVRPGAGTGDFAVNYNEKEAYLSHVKGDVTDNTIKDITTAIKGISGTLGKLPGGKAPISLASAMPNIRDNAKVDRIESVIATGLFDIHERNVQERIHDFLHKHLNGCQAPCVPPGITFDAPLPNTHGAAPANPPASSLGTSAPPPSRTGTVGTVRVSE